MLTAPIMPVADITYIRLAEEFVYLAVVMDAFRKRRLGARRSSAGQPAARGARQGHRLAWRFAEGPDPSFRPRRAIRLPRLRLAPEPDRLHASMSRPGTPQDNAKAESFMHTLKAEEVDGKAYRSREDAESKIGYLSTTSTMPADCIPRSAISRPLSSKTNSDKLRNVKQTNPCPCHRISRVSAEGRSPEVSP